ncbi:uncharacterized protein LOC126656805 [Mercurialis annua]|uniref:uncharacterized protein LOC126656805 n=1 Tax=Mercurialis annua TaxID=3986 RepID=UPI002160472A|nr:uncharacterized protein LOC126656805 [Mercurialis annua]
MIGWSLIDNYEYSENGRIWIMYDGESTLSWTLVYGASSIVERQKMWVDLVDYTKSIAGAWIIQGDFNAVIGDVDILGGNELDSDHTMEWDIVTEEWDKDVVGFSMFKVVKKLKAIRYRLSKLNRRHFSDITHKVNIQRERLKINQKDLQKDLMNEYLICEEKAMTIHLRFLLKCEESFLKQKSRIQWLKLGDANTKYFHIVIKQRRAKNSIHVLKLDNRSTIRGTKEIHKEEEKLTNEDGDSLLRVVSEEEVKQVVFSIGSNKVDIIKLDLLKAVRESFNSGKILKQINCTSITVIPKCNNAENLSDFRPIACCNVVYKVITKIISTRLSPLLMNIVSQNQSAFIPKRSIAHNIMLAHELVKNYHRNSGPPRCLLKIDLRKAYDSIDWDFIEGVFIGLNFPNKFISLVMDCIRTPSKTVLWNGNSGDKFYSSKGLRQGDPIVSNNFKFHYGCNSLKLNHLIFADDLLLFCHGNNTSVTYFMDNLNSFKAKSGLQVNTNKSQLLYCRMQLINSVLMSMHEFWASILILPKSVVREIQKACNRFFWTGKEEGKYNAMVSWKDISKLKKEGGLGVKDIHIWNKAAITKHIWQIFNNPESIWVKWIKVNKLRRRSFWGAKNNDKSNWIWRGIPNTRSEARRLIEYKFGNGTNTNFWDDPWVQGCTMMEKFPRVKMRDTDIPNHTTDADLWRNNRWEFPDPSDEATEEAWEFIRHNIRPGNNEDSIY